MMGGVLDSAWTVIGLAFIGQPQATIDSARTHHVECGPEGRAKAAKLAMLLVETDCTGQLADAKGVAKRWAAYCARRDAA